MKNLKLKQLLVWSLFLGFVLVFTQCEKENAMNDEPANENSAQLRDYETVCDCLLLEYPEEDLSAKENESLIYMREEEKLARDVYTYLFDKWGNKIFKNISTSEQKHMDLLLCLINKYGIVDPVSTNGFGVFGNEELQVLYNELIVQGEKDLVKAMLVGATIEDLDIDDLRSHAANFDNEDLVAVYNELERGSRNHLRAFSKNLEMLESSYTSVFIDEELYYDIINSAKEKGSELCNGMLICEGQKNQNCPGVCNGKGNSNKNGNCNGTGNGTNGNGGGNGGGN